MTEDTVQNCLVYGGNVSCLFRCRSRRRRDRGSRSEVNLPGDYLETSTVINYAKLPSQWEPRSCSQRRRRLLLESMLYTTSPCCLGPRADAPTDWRVRTLSSRSSQRCSFIGFVLRLTEDETQSISHTVFPAAAALYLASLSAVWLPVYHRFGSDVKTEGMWQTWHVIFHSLMAACDIWRYYKVLSARLQWSVRTRSFLRCFTGRLMTCVSFQLVGEGWYRGILVYVVVLNDRCVHTILLSFFS